jgi:hypothetical protein
MKVLRLLALPTDRLYPPGSIPGTHFCYWPSQPQGHNAARKIMLMKNSSDTIGNRTSDLEACSAVQDLKVGFKVIFKITFILVIHMSTCKN